MDNEPPILPFTRPPRAKGFFRPPPPADDEAIACPHCRGPLTATVTIEAPPELHCPHCQRPLVGKVSLDVPPGSSDGAA